MYTILPYQPQNLQQLPGQRLQTRARSWRSMTSNLPRSIGLSTGRSLWRWAPARWSRSFMTMARSGPWDIWQESQKPWATSPRTTQFQWASTRPGGRDGQHRTARAPRGRCRNESGEAVWDWVVLFFFRNPKVILRMNYYAKGFFLISLITPNQISNQGPKWVCLKMLG